LFKGSKNLFEGLNIYSTNYSFESFPVVYLDMSLLSDSTDTLEADLIDLITRKAKLEDLSVNVLKPSLALSFLIEDLSKKYGKKVVVLIDEYDAPVSTYIDSIDLAEKNSRVLRSFYSSFKSCRDHLHFVFVTGVTRYALMGLSAGLNHLKDISFDPNYSTICGFTPTEMDFYLGNRYYTLLNSLKSNGAMPSESTVEDLRKELLSWYDGYSWDGKTRLLNPISILKTFDMQKFDHFWYNTYPSEEFISNIFNRSPFELTPNKLINIPTTYFHSVSVKKLHIPPLLFQTGYLTIDNIEFIEKDKHLVETYSLKPPNFEVKDQYNDFYKEALSRHLIKDPAKEKVQLFQAITSCDGLQFSNIVAALYKRLPALHHTQKDDTESFYHSILWAYCSGLVSSSEAEEPNSGGNLDLLLVLMDDTHVVIELKYAKNMGQENVDELLDQLANKALQSISSHDYGGQYRLQGKKFITIGLGVFGRGQVKAVFGQQPERS
jgi:hypothetical protein